MDSENWIIATLFITLVLAIVGGVFLGKHNDRLTIRVAMVSQTATIPVEYTPGDPMPDTLVFNGTKYAMVRHNYLPSAK